MWLLLFALSSVVRPSQGGCPPNYQVINNICFGLKTATSMDWDQADKLCHQEHTRLARVDPDHVTRLLKVLPRGARAWIGLRYDKGKHKWIWTKDHSSADMSLPYLRALDLNATDEDDCAVIRMKKNVIGIEADTCTDKWLNTALCSMEKESCGYSMTQNFGVCEFEGNETCYKKAVYTVDGGSLPRHLNTCQIDDIDCRVVFSADGNGTIGCALDCGENANVGGNDTIKMTDDCKQVLVGTKCDCQEAVEALARGARGSNRLGLHIGIAMLSVITAVLIAGAVISYIRRRRKQHTERIHPPAPSSIVRYSVDPIKFRSDTAPY